MKSMWDNFQYKKIKTPPKHWGDVTDEDEYEELLPKLKPKPSDEIKEENKGSKLMKFIKTYTHSDNSYIRL